MSELPRLVVILGPTASGKSELGIRLAEQLGGEILACDSTQVYRHFDIGTAKVPVAERRGIPHHLIDLVEPDEIFTAGDYRKRAVEALDDLRARGKMPILTAGTGLYLRALLEGLADAPTRSKDLRDRLRARAERHGAEYLHRLLARLDRASADRIAPRDTQKIIRAIEIRVLAGKAVADVHRGGRIGLEGYDVRKIGLLPARPALYSRIEARVVSMMEAGWLDEVRALVASGIPADAKPFQFIGYAELRSCIQGSLERHAAIREIQQSTRQFAKRQITWFRREKGVEWLAGFGDDPDIQAAALEIARAPLPRV
ncbi:MAG TPA: tRNA (adenosine(37)-N6)-dimethylallyltransferase MiaA [Candidatus Acidoferrales bacterium]|jgi:tRNA dimethylallyltransferase|nr:tRNA (adenosine(37)-N6)-dimethylallyltransferase MiaA [Candidatus Acidoferrales bacterium]